MGPFVQDLPFGVVLGIPVLAARMKFIPAGLLSQRIFEQRTVFRLAGVDHSRGGREVLAGLFVVPSRRAGREALKPKRRTGGMAHVAAGMALALGQQNRLYLGLEELEIQRRGLRERRAGREQ